MAFAQHTYRESLRDIEFCLRAMQGDFIIWVFTAMYLAAHFVMQMKHEIGVSTVTLPRINPWGPTTIYWRWFRPRTRRYRLRIGFIDNRSLFIGFSMGSIRQTKSTIKLYTRPAGGYPNFHLGHRWRGLWFQCAWSTHPGTGRYLSNRSRLFGF